MPDIFLSYNREDQAVARRYAEAFAAHGFEVWWDSTLRAGEAYDEVTEQALRSAKAVVVLWSKKSVVSRWVRAEATLADRNKTLVPCMIEPCERPIMFELTQTAELSHWQGDAQDKAWLAFLDDVQRFVGAGPAKAAAAIGSLAEIAATIPKPAEPLLAVLAFDNLSGDPEMAFFSDGVSEEIRETVARGASLRVIGRTSSFQFRGERKAQAAQALNATHTLDGSVRRNGQRVRISTDLVECATQTTLWSNRFDRELTDVFALQDEIAAAVAEALKVTFAPQNPVGAVDPAAYELYLMARNVSTGANLDVSPKIAAFERVVAAAPGLAPAWATLADLRALELRARERGVEEYERGRRAVVEAADTALRLDPNSGSAYVALSRLEPYANYEAREALLQRALAASPNDPTCLIDNGVFLVALGRQREYRPYILQAYDLDPLYGNAAFSRAVAASVVGDQDEGRRLWETFRAQWPNEEVLGATELSGLFLRADWEGFDRVAAQLRARGVRDADTRRLLSMSDLRTSTPEVLSRMLNRLIGSIDRTGTASIFDLWIAYSVGLKDETFALIEQASFAHLFDPRGAPPAGTQRLGFLFIAETDRHMACDPRFVRLCHKLGMCEYWVKTERWPDCADEVEYDFRAEAKSLVAEGLSRS